MSIASASPKPLRLQPACIRSDRPATWNAVPRVIQLRNVLCEAPVLVQRVQPLVDHPSDTLQPIDVGRQEPPAAPSGFGEWATSREQCQRTPGIEQVGHAQRLFAHDVPEDRARPVCVLQRLIAPPAGQLVLSPVSDRRALQLEFPIVRVALLSHCGHEVADRACQRSTFTLENRHHQMMTCRPSSDRAEANKIRLALPVDVMRGACESVTSTLSCRFRAGTASRITPAGAARIVEHRSDRTFIGLLREADADFALRAFPR